MHDAIKGKWADALRSGEYDRIRGEMHNDDGFCPLGILCDVVKDHVDGEWAEWTTYTYEFRPHGRAEDAGIGDLPESVANYVGLDSPDPMLSISDDTGDRELARRVSTINDNGLADWNELANYIEEQL